MAKVSHECNTHGPLVYTKPFFRYDVYRKNISNKLSQQKKSTDKKRFVFKCISRDYNIIILQLLFKAVS